MKNISIAALISVCVFLSTPAFAQSMPNTDEPGYTEEQVNAIFTSGKWHFFGKGWSNDREFHNDKTFSGGGDGFWRMGTNEIIVTTGGKIMKLKLPLDPKGTFGIGSTGDAVLIYRDGEKPVPYPANGKIPANWKASTAAGMSPVRPMSTPIPPISKNPPPPPAATPQIVRATPTPSPTPAAPVTPPVSSPDGTPITVFGSKAVR